MSGGRGLAWLYGTLPGRMCLKVLTAPWLSRAAGAFLSSRPSRRLIPGFIRRGGIDMSDYPAREYRSFNDFFTRALGEGARPVDGRPEALIAPCDSRLSVYTIGADTRLRVKGRLYTVNALLDAPEGDSLAQSFTGGTALVFRLCVEDYHRYVYFDDARQGPAVAIPGRLHTVRPAALARTDVLAQNCREYCVLDTAHFGRAVQMEVGAMMVGRIRNHNRAPAAVRRGEEKGMFLFGGSTVVLLLPSGAAELSPEFEAVRGRDAEVKVRLGRAIGRQAAP